MSENNKYSGTKSIKDIGWLVRKPIKDFGWFVTNVHRKLSPTAKELPLENAEQYADLGVGFLQALLEPNPEFDAKYSSADIANCILWALIRFAYQNNYPFGKGMFNIIFSDDPKENNKMVMKLYEILSQNSYRRLSSHYADQILTDTSSAILGFSLVRGLDIDRSTIPCPAKFETILFAPIRLKNPQDKRIALAFKPENNSFDILRPIRAFKHSISWIDSGIEKQRTPEETVPFREKTSKRNTDYLPNKNLKGSELIMRATKGGLIQEPDHKLINEAKARQKGITKLRPEDDFDRI